MDIAQLKDLLSSPESSRRLQATVQQFIRDEQREAYFAQISKSLQDTRLRSFRFIAETETIIVTGVDLLIRSRGGELVINPRDEQGAGFVVVKRESNGDIVSEDKARQVRITIDFPDAPANADDATPRRMTVNAQEYDSIVQADEDPAPHETYRRSVNIPMPDDLRAMEHNDVRHYLTSRTAGKREQDELKVNYNKLISSIRSEMHARASFAVSCFILVMVGCALGMISKSGNFLSAFAVSVVPALLCIALIVTGQHVCENTPQSMGMGLSLIWSGNVIVLIMAVFLLGKLQRQ
jgi:lipopolysaccharide export LptBFGC system permease protein LptF